MNPAPPAAEEHVLRVSLRERVKELGCLYAVSQVAVRDDAPLGEMLRGIVDLLPPAWLHPSVASARIVLDGVAVATPGFPEAGARQSSDVVVDGVHRGFVEVAYSVPRPAADEGPFLREERALLDEVARQVARVVERREAAEAKTRLEVQLLHADRLATIGQLAAGVAHELNEPLAVVLGFAQLALKEPELPAGVREDVERIRAASLHAREVVRKLLLFARQQPPRKAPVDLGQLVGEGLFVLEARCAKAGIEVVRDLAPRLPPLVADAAQVRQVIVNLAVNAVQAMPSGGRLTVRASADGDWIVLAVEDTGIGMSPEVLRQAFVPFFTTKEVGEGTGLGLSVVHGIVKAHGGTVRLESGEGRGTQVEVRFPAAPANGGGEA